MASERVSLFSGCCLGVGAAIWRGVFLPAAAPVIFGSVTVGTVIAVWHGVLFVVVLS